MINVRVYGILVNEQNEVLVSDELIRGMRITKFCGGGLEEGEGTRECLKREFMEEMNLDVEIGEHFYTTDFYQPSAFRKGDQILSIYYRVKPLQPITAKVSDSPFDFNVAQMSIYETTQQIENFRFISMCDFNESCMTLPIDKVIAEMVVTKFYEFPF
jgi:8-oxo-dGTP diphosphatase